jgi:hypothetical protein
MKKALTVPILFTILALMILPMTPVQISSAASLITIPTDFPTIQSAINAASQGDTIKVLPGTYVEQVAISKSLTIIGSGAKSTIIKAPAVLPDTNVIGRPYIVDVNNAAKVSMKGFTITGPDDTACDDLTGLSVMEGATLNLEAAAVKGCTVHGIQAGAASFFLNGPKVGHATITKTDITDYRSEGIIAFWSGSTLSVSRSRIVPAEAPETVGQVGIIVVFGAKGTITYNKVSGNICNNPACGPDFFNQIQAFGIAAPEADAGTVISYNDVSNNDIGIGVFFNSGCCKIEHNKLTDNRFFGSVIGEGDHTISYTKIYGGIVGVAAVATSVDTVVTLDHVKIVDTITPVQELSCCGSPAKVVSFPRSFQ